MGGFFKAQNPYATPISIPAAVPMAHPVGPVGQHPIGPQAGVQAGPIGQHPTAPQGQAYYNQRMQEIQAAQLAEALRQKQYAEWEAQQQAAQQQEAQQNYFG